MPDPQEDQFFALVTTGRKGVETMLTTMGPELRKVASRNVADDFDAWSTRALVEITTNDNLTPIIQTRQGIHSIYKGLAKAATLGLQVGGALVAHCYFVPKGGKAALIDTADGRQFATVYGPGAVLKGVPECVAVYERDKFSVDNASGQVVHEYPDSDPFADRGKLRGWYMIQEYIDGRRIVRVMAQTKVVEIEKAYGQTNSPAYQKSPDEMHYKTAKKFLLRQPVKEAEGLAMRIAVEEGRAAAEELPRIIEPSAPMRDVTERTGSRLDQAMDRLKADPDPEDDDEPGEDPEPEAGEAVDQEELF